MFKHIFAVLVALGIGLAGSAMAKQDPTEKDAVAMADKAAALFNSKGKAHLIERILAKDPEFLDGELYVVLLRLDGTIIANPVNAKLIGQSLLDVPDADGKMFRKERVDLAASTGKGWVQYRFKNPVSGKIEQKTAYVLKVGDSIITVGVYKN